MALACLASLPVRAIDLDVDARDRDVALQVARDTDAVRQRFHAPYIRAVNGEAVERIEVITETRRLVLIAEERIRAGDHAFARGVRAPQEALAPWKQRVSIVARLRLPPHNTYVTTPPMDVTLGIAPEGVRPLAVERQAIYAQPMGAETIGMPIVGAVVESTFDAVAVGQRTLSVIVWLGAEEAARTTIDFGRLR